MATVIIIKKLLTLSLIMTLAMGSLAFSNPITEDEYSYLREVLLSLNNTQATNPIAEAPAQNVVPYYQTVLGNERLLSEYSHLIDGKRVGIVTNHTGVNSKLERTVDVLSAYPKISLTSIYSPEHGLDGTVAAGKYVESYTDAKLNLPVYSLYGKTRKPSPEMLTNVDVLVFDMQDIGS